jgi:hypothetical protein
MPSSPVLFNPEDDCLFRIVIQTKFLSNKPLFDKSLFTERHNQSVCYRGGLLVKNFTSTSQLLIAIYTTLWHVATQQKIHCNANGSGYRADSATTILLTS